MTTFEQARAMYGSDEQMARDLFEQLVIVRNDLELQQTLRRRAENSQRGRRKPMTTTTNIDETT